MEMHQICSDRHPAAIRFPFTAIPHHQVRIIAIRYKSNGLHVNLINAAYNAEKFERVRDMFEKEFYKQFDDGPEK